MNENGWSRYEELVLSEIKRLSDRVEALEQKMDRKFEKMDTTISTAAVDREKLRNMASGWGGMAGGLVAALGAILVQLLKQFTNPN